MAEKKDLGTPIGTTLDRFIKSKQDEFKYATGELSQLLRDIALAGKIVNKEVISAGLSGLNGQVGEVNVQGENQQKLDVVAHIRFTRALTNGRMTAAVVSEEEEKIIHINEDNHYIVAIDPLDGSSNIDVNVSVGTIFSIYRRKSPTGTKVTKSDILQKGSAQVAAGYILYGSSTMFVYTTGFGVNGFTLDLSLGEFILSHPEMKFPKEVAYYSINESLLEDSEPYISKFVMSCRKQGLSARYIGSLVADFHRNMLKGGIYLYPKTSDKPNGKLRLLYECYALAFIAEQANGVATDGVNRILDIDPKEFHQRTEFYVGSKSLMEELNRFN
ncbi:MAG: class 1 fructose-bisphosphatase [Cyclobacteriaceae bacterium]|nr:class 1 fructose-bisphosphatase [Cyclobacteriaceae bacterium SS2]